MSKDAQASTLYLVGTPIGNLEDITFRAVRILQEVDLIAAEDTRHTGKLLHHFQIKTPQISCHEHNERQQIPQLITKLEAGQSIAVVTDAGMPGISDPGFLLVAACVAAGINVVPIPGVTAVITGLSASGLASDRFVFEGFLPVKGIERQQRLSAIKSETRTLVFYEAPHRLCRTLADLAAQLTPDRQVVLARELTKMHEQFWRGNLGEAIDYHQTKEPQGEYVVVVAGAEFLEPQWSDDLIKTELVQLLAQGISRSDASKQLASLTAVNKRHIYQLSLQISDG
jgi:16S rRNA (cytidine1402-2'-O)-methyltransferase